MSSIYRIRVPLCQFNDLICPRLAFVHRQSCPAIDIIILHTHASLRALFSSLFLISISFLCFIIVSLSTNNHLPSTISSFTFIHRSYFLFSPFSFQLVSRSLFRTRACYSITRSAYDASCAASRSLRFKFSNPKPVSIEHPSRKI